MTFDTPAADAAPTRRSSRTGQEPAVASEPAVSSRADRRRARHGEVIFATAIDPVAPAGPEPLATIPSPLRAGQRSRPRNEPLTDAEAEAVSGAGLDAERRIDEARPVSAPDDAQTPLTRRSARRVSVPAQAAGAGAGEAAPEESVARAEAPAPAPAEASLPREQFPPVASDVPGAHATPATAEIPRVYPVPPAPEAPRVDEGADLFEAAVRMFGATGETATIPPARVEVSVHNADKSEPVAPAPRGRGPLRRPGSLRRLTATSFSVGVMGIVGLLAVGMTTPVEAVAAATSGDGEVTSILALSGTDADTTTEDIQAYVAPSGTESVSLSRDEGYAAVTMSELAVEAGVRDTSSTYVNNSASAVQYPFPVGVPISSPYGMRWGYLHAGVDFVPGGEGAEIHAIADGVVRIATEAGGSYGVHVIIDHIVDGEVVSSHYAHMQYGSLKVKSGDVVKLGDVIGTVGTTGHSTGPHLHFEILLNGTTPTEPMAWMAEHNVASTVVTMPDGVLVTDQ